MMQKVCKYKKTKAITASVGKTVSHGFFGVLLLLIAYCLPLAAQRIDYTRWVNPFIGTGAHGHTFPGATMPFGMVQLSPDTRTDNWDGSSGYHYSDDVIYGFSHTHLSGTGIPDYCDILFMPMMGEAPEIGPLWDTREPAYSSRFSHTNEKAEPGYYAVSLDKNGIGVELTASARVGLHRYAFSQAGTASVVLDLKWRDKLLDSSITVIGNNRIEGYRRSSSWAKDQVIYFSAEFSKPFTQVLEQDGRFDYIRGQGDPIKRSWTTGKYGRIIQFAVAAGEKIQIKVALSPVSIEGARKNLAAEMPGWDFDKVRADAKAAWNKELSKIEVSGGTDAQMTTFYTALYHTMIQPNIFNDVDGNYLGHDGKIHNIADDVQKPESVSSPHVSKGSSSQERTTPSTQSGGHPSFVRRGAISPRPGVPPSPRHSDEYTVFSLWDTFRAAHPLYTIIDQRRTVDFINTFIRQYEQGGRLPVWELAGNETDCMIGYHAVSVIADAMAKGIKGFDYEKAYAAAKHSAELDHFGLAAYKKRGYISMEDENESVSKTLEYAYDDWCIAQMAQARYRYWLIRSSWQAVEYTKAYQTDSKKYSERARSFENLFDPSTGFMRPKKNGGFISPFAPNEVTFNFTEGNSWQYSFFVPQDVNRLMELMGGREKFTAELDELFTTSQKLGGREQADLTGLIGQYAHGNEPSHHIAYLYDYAGEPWKTQKYVRQIMDEFYKPTPDGLIGNEDCGQMSAWYVLSASGIYEVTHGLPLYAFGTPLFPEVIYHLENGKTFTIKAPGVSSKNFYIKSAKLNGAPHVYAGIWQEYIMLGGVLEFEMTDHPVLPVTEAFKLVPGSTIVTDTTPMPAIGDGRRTFQKSLTFSIQNISPYSKVYYTLDGTEPSDRSTLYTNPITINATTTVRAVAINQRGVKSHIAEATFKLISNDWTVNVVSGYSRQYTGGGDNAIVDGIRGTTNFASGEWQGIQGKPYEAIVDLQRMTEIHELGGSFLQVASPWIWMPDRIEFEVSADGVNFTRAAEIKPGFPQTQMTPTIREYRQKITPTNARYVRMRTYNFGKIPSWHPGAGGDPWIFVDEIFIS